MNKIFLGTEYGGWVVDLDLINENDTIICAGVGEDISFETELINTYQPSFIKMDVEGSEYNVLLECLGVKQICVEFHHHCLNDKKLDDTLNLVNKFLDYVYEIIDNRQNYQELTFVLKK